MSACQCLCGYLHVNTRCRCAKVATTTVHVAPVNSDDEPIVYDTCSNCASAIASESSPSLAA